MIVSFVGLLFFLIGPAVFIRGIFSIFKVRRQVAESAKATGTVINFGKTMGRSGYLYCPQVAFTAENGQPVQFQSGFGTQPPAYSVGQTVQIIYKRTNPQEAEIDSLAAVWFEPGCLTVMGVAFTGLGLMLIVVGILVQLGTYTNNGK